LLSLHKYAAVLRTPEIVTAKPAVAQVYRIELSIFTFFVIKIHALQICNTRHMTARVSAPRPIPGRILWCAFGQEIALDGAR
jgi:hypothetical protein